MQVPAEVAQRVADAAPVIRAEVGGGIGHSMIDWITWWLLKPQVL